MNVTPPPPFGEPRAPSRAVSPWELRRVFNESGMWAMSLTPPPYARRLVKRQNANPAYNQPPGTLSETWAVWNEEENLKVAIVHMYAHPDGNSTLPDPKFLRLNGVVLTC